MIGSPKQFKHAATFATSPPTLLMPEVIYGWNNLLHSDWRQSADLRRVNQEKPSNLPAMHKEWRIFK